MSKTRLEAFTDAIIAIIMTLLVLELAPPQGDSLSSLLNLKFKFLVYLISFISLAIYWNNHHHLFQATEKIDGSIMWINTLFILFFSLYPFTTAWVDEHIMARVPEIVYGAQVMLTNIAYAFLAKRIIQVNGPQSRVARALSKGKKQTITLLLNAAGIALSFVYPPIVLILFALSMLLWVIPDRRLERILNDDEQ